MPKNKRRNKAQNTNNNGNNNEENININNVDDNNATDSSVISGIPADFDPYDDEQTKAIVGSLFDEFVEEGGVNYFADYSDPFLDAENEDDDESLGDSISRRRKKSPITTDNGKVVFRKRVKKQELESEPEDNYDEDDEDEESSNGLDKTIILTTINKLFKKSSQSEDEYEDDEDSEQEDEFDTSSVNTSDDDIDDFFSSLKKDSSARIKAAAAKESAEPVHNASRDDIEEENPYSNDTAPANDAAPMLPRRRRSKNVFADIDSPYNTGIEQHNSKSEEDADDDGYEVKVVSISPFTVVLTGLLVLAVIIVTVLAYSNHKFSKQLDEARTQITELQKSSSSTYETELEELKKQVADLTAENEQLKGGDSSTEDPHAAAVEILNEAQNEVSTQEAVNTNISQGESNGNTYTVKAGDTPWKISQSVYGNGANYQKILDANGLTENSVLNEGQVLKIPN